MKNTFLVVSALLTTLSLYSQNTPFGFHLNDDDFARIEVMELATFNHNSLLVEDSETERLGGRTNVGRLIELNVNENTSGTWTTLPNGDLIWQFRFRSAGAKGISVYFDDLFLPEGSNMVLYPNSRKYFDGPYNNADCNDHGHFVAGEVTGDEAILEYYQPASVVGDARLGIRAVGHYYRFVYDYAEEEAESQRGGSDVCEVDVNCPEGLGWEAQRDAVVRLTIVEGNLIGYCSGSMVNTTAMDCRQYLLTAFHCGTSVSDTEWLDCQIRYRYQSTNCGGGAVASAYNRVGVFHLADSNDGGGDSGSDFLLLEVEDDLPESYDVFYAGWDANAVTPADVKGIHHPSGDRKKISTATNIISGTWGAPGYHWRLEWMDTETNWGVTEGGSSGSPIFNFEKRIVGQLTGGLSCCTEGGCDPPQFTGPSEPDFYGKMDKNWDDNPNSASQKLKVWLDPEDTGILAMDGSYENFGASQPCSPTTGVNNRALQFNDVAIYPTISDNEFSISSPRYKSIREVRIFSTSGQLIKTMLFGSETTQVATGDLADGVYYISFVAENDSHVTKKFVVAHR